MKTFRITLEDDVEAVIYKAKGIADKYGASFEGDTETGIFNSNGVEGHYKITRNSKDTKNVINIQITKKPIVIPWQLVNATLSSFFGSSVSDGAGAHKVTSNKDTNKKDMADKGNKNKKVSVSGNVSANASATGSVKVNASGEDAKTKTDSTNKASSGRDSNSESVNSNENGTGGLSGINWRFFQNENKPSNSSKAKDGVVDADFVDATVTDNSPEGQAKAERRAKAQEVINSHVLWAAGSGFIPVPLADMAALTALQVGMLEQLATLYGVETSQATGKGFVKALTGSGVAKLAASFMKTIPVIGTIPGVLAMSITGGASTYALGQVAIEQFENERDLDSVDLEEAKAKYNEAYEEGKDITEKIKKEEFKQVKEEEIFEGNETTTAKTSVDADASVSEASDIFEKIEKLGSLKDKGLISNEEFETQKAKLLDRL